MKQALLDRGVSLTPRREKLLEVLIASDNHPSASEIHEGVRRYYPGTSLATIYNTIELLKETGQVLEIEFSGAANRYDGRIPDSHPHLICLECERVDDLQLPEDDGSLGEIAKATGYQIVRRRTDYYGICPECQIKQGGAAPSKGGDSTSDL
ncbi:MAG: transcriptional repressor [Chloroflexi bacterium]|nr:transcriptional repressor [Chloroflexota bacterium]